MIQCPPGPWVIQRGRFEFFRKLAEILANECLSTAPAINSCHGFSVIASVVDTGDKFIIGDNDTGEQLSSVTKTPAICLFLVTMTPVNRVWGCLWMSLFMAVRIQLSAAVSDLDGLRYRRFWFEVVLAASNQGVWGVYGCAFSWRFQWHYWRLCLILAAGDNAVLVLAASTSFPIVVDTGQKSPKSLKFSPVSTIAVLTIPACL